MRIRISIDAQAYILLSCYLLLMPFGWVAGAVLAAAVHELGHCVALWCFDRKIYRIQIKAFGARIETEQMSEGQMLWCALAGPGAGLCCALLWRVFPQAAFCALVQTAFNLLPLYPFDGGRVLGALRAMRGDKSVAKSGGSVYNNSN